MITNRTTSLLHPKLNVGSGPHSRRLPTSADGPLPTHCCPWPISRRVTGLPRNLTVAHAAENACDGDGRSRVATINRQEILAERLHPKPANSPFRPKGARHLRPGRTTAREIRRLTQGLRRRPRDQREAALPLERHSPTTARPASSRSAVAGSGTARTAQA